MSNVSYPDALTATRRRSRLNPRWPAVMVGSALLAACGGGGGGKLGDIESIAPANTVMVGAFDGLDDMVEQMGEMMERLGEVAAYLPPGATEEIAAGLVGTTAILGFDPTSPESFSAIGLDLSRPVASFATPSVELMTLPVSDKEAFHGFITRMTGEAIQEQEIGDQTLYSLEGLGGWAYKNKTLVGYTLDPWSSPAEMQAQFLAVLSDESSLKDNESFKKLNSAMGKDWSVMVWANPSFMAAQDPDFLEFQQIVGLESVGFHISEKGSEASFNLMGDMRDEAPILEYLKAVDGSSNDVLAEQLSGSPIGVARMSMDAPAFLDMVRKVPSVSMQEGLAEMTREMAREGLILDQVAGMLPKNLGGAFFFNAMGGLELWVGGEMGEDTTAVPWFTSAMASDCDSSSSWRSQTLQVIPGGLACLTERRGEFEMVALSEGLGAVAMGAAMTEPAILQNQIIGRLLGIGNDKGYGEEGLSKAAKKALDAKGIMTAYLDVSAGLKALSTSPEFLQDAGPMGAMGLGLLANQFSEGLQARVWLDGSVLKGSASMDLGDLEFGGGSSAAAAMGLMAAVAIPNFIEMQYKAKRAEVPSNVKALKEAQEIYNSENDGYLWVPAHPLGAPGPEARPWGSGNSGFNNLNWHPDGNVRGVYSVTTTPASRYSWGGDFKVMGIIDVDGDGVYATYTATKSINTTLITPNDVF